MSEVISISGTIGIAHKGIGRGSHVRLVVDGTIDSYTERDTAHKGTEQKFNIRAEAGHLLKGKESQQFDTVIAEVRAAQGEDHPGQDAFEYDAPDGDGGTVDIDQDGTE